MTAYNPAFLDNITVFTDEELTILYDINSTISLEKFLNNSSYVEKFGVDFIHTSAKIEGNTYSMNDTLTLLEYGRTAGGKKYSDAKMILNMRDAYDRLIREDLPVTKETLKELHYILSDEMVAKHERATPRDEEVTIKGSSYVPLATKERLDDELNYMFAKYQEIQEPFDKALYLHCNLAYLQYFKDCNKRTARLMLNVSLKNDDKMIYIPNEKRISNYLASIVSYYETGNYQQFKRYFLEEYEDVGNTISFVEESKRLEQEKKPFRTL